MTHKKIIPCLDLKDGRLVKGVKFLNLKNAGNAVEKALRYAEDGADALVALNISTSPEGYRATLEVIREIVRQVNVPVICGGGISSLGSMHELFQQGVAKVAINTAALENPGLIDSAARRFESQQVIVAVDALRSPSSPNSLTWEVYVGSGNRPAGRDAVSWCVEAVRRGAGEILLTSIDSDGTRNGYDLELLATVADAVPVPIIASGGAGSPEHLAEALTAGKAQAVLIASLLHYGDYTVASLKRYLAEQGLPVSL